MDSDLVVVDSVVKLVKQLYVCMWKRCNCGNAVCGNAVSVYGNAVCDEKKTLMIGL